MLLRRANANKVWANAIIFRNQKITVGVYQFFLEIMFYTMLVILRAFIIN